MRVFGTKQVQPTDEDRAAAARLSAVAARFRTDWPQTEEQAQTETSEDSAETEIEE